MILRQQVRPCGIVGPLLGPECADCGECAVPPSWKGTRGSSYLSRLPEHPEPGELRPASAADRERAYRAGIRWAKRQGGGACIWEKGSELAEEWKAGLLVGLRDGRS
jgi:hypothetical protein